MTKEQIEKFINDMDAYIPIYKIEELLGMPATTLQKFLSGERGLPKKWDRPLEMYFSNKGKIKIQDANKQTSTVKNLTEPKPTTNHAINTGEQRSHVYMNDAIKKKLGIK